MSPKMQSAEATPLLADSAAPAEAETDEEQVSRISAAVARARCALEEVRAKVGEYDAQYKASETASAYLGGSLQKVQSSFDALSTTVSTLKDKTVEIPTKALSRTLSAANSAMAEVTERTASFDNRFQLSSKVQMAVSVPQEKCMTALVEVSNLAASVSAAANAKIQGVNHSICSRAVGIASSSASLIFSTAAALDDRFAIQSKAITAGTAVAGKAKTVDDCYNVKDNVGSLATGGLERARGLDSRVTGGRVTPIVLSAFEAGISMAAGGLAFVQTGYESAKQQRQGKDGYPAAEAMVASENADVTPQKTQKVAEAEAMVASENADVTPQKTQKVAEESNEEVGEEKAAAAGVEDITDKAVGERKAMRAKFDKDCPAESKPIYESKQFRNNFERMFREADTYKKLALGVTELKKPMQNLMSNGETPTIVEDEDVEEVLEAFDDDQDGFINIVEFVEIMKFLSMQQDLGLGVR